MPLNLEALKAHKSLVAGRRAASHRNRWLVLRIKAETQLHYVPKSRFGTMAAAFLAAARKESAA